MLIRERIFKTVNLLELLLWCQNANLQHTCQKNYLCFTYTHNYSTFSCSVLDNDIVFVAKVELHPQYVFTPDLLRTLQL